MECTFGALGTARGCVSRKKEQGWPEGSRGEIQNRKKDPGHSSRLWIQPGLETRLVNQPTPFSLSEFELRFCLSLASETDLNNTRGRDVLTF